MSRRRACCDGLQTCSRTELLEAIAHAEQRGRARNIGQFIRFRDGVWQISTAAPPDRRRS